jgi:hypothetical protein
MLDSLDDSDRRAATARLVRLAEQSLRSACYGDFLGDVATKLRARRHLVRSKAES